MTQAIRLQREFSKPTTISTSPSIRRVVSETSTGFGPIAIIEAQVVFSPIPKDYMAINQVVAQFESEPHKAVALRKARKRLADRSRSEDATLTLAAIRLGRGLSQSALAQKISTSQSRLSRIETGIDEIYFSTFEKLKTALNISRDELATALQRSKGTR